MDIYVYIYVYICIHISARGGEALGFGEGCAPGSFLSLFSFPFFFHALLSGVGCRVKGEG